MSQADPLDESIVYRWVAGTGNLIVYAEHVSRLVRDAYVVIRSKGNTLPRSTKSCV